MNERDFQKKTMQKIRELLPGCITMKNDSSYIQGIPDFIILYNDKWACLEFKKSEHAIHRPNQDYYVNKMDDMSFAAFIYPENEEEIINATLDYFNT